MLNQIHIGDTLALLKTFPDECVDIICTSPPYNKQGAKGKLVKEVKYNNSSDNQPEPNYQGQQIDVLNELFRITKPGGHLFYNHKLRWIDGRMYHPYSLIVPTQWGDKVRQEIIWDREIAANLRGWRFWQVEERIFWCQKGITIGDEIQSRHAKLSSIWSIRPESRFPDHPAPFPVAIPTRCIYSVADDKKGLTVLDPYCGTGTTLISAKLLGHNYIGIDCCSDYKEIFQRRLDNNLDQELVEKELKLHVVVKSYAERKKKLDVS